MRRRWWIDPETQFQINISCSKIGNEFVFHATAVVHDIYTLRTWKYGDTGHKLSVAIDRAITKAKAAQ